MLGTAIEVAIRTGRADRFTEELSHPAPVFHGDTLFAETEVLEVRGVASQSPTAARCRVHTRVLNQDGTLVAEFKRLVLVPEARSLNVTGKTA